MTYFPNMPPLVTPWVGFNRPSDSVTAYTAGDLIANSTTGASVAPIILPAARGINVPSSILRARIRKSSAVILGAIFRLHLFNEAKTFATGDNTPFSTTKSGYLGFIDVDVTERTFSDGAWGVGTPFAGSAINAAPVTGTINYHGYLELFGSTYALTASELIEASLEVA